MLHEHLNGAALLETVAASVAELPEQIIALFTVTVGLSKLTVEESGAETFPVESVTITA